MPSAKGMISRRSTSDLRTKQCPYCMEVVSIHKFELYCSLHCRTMILRRSSEPEAQSSLRGFEFTRALDHTNEFEPEVEVGTI